MILSEFWSTSRYDLQNFRKRMFLGDDQGELSKGTVDNLGPTTKFTLMLQLYSRVCRVIRVILIEGCPTMEVAVPHGSSARRIAAARRRLRGGDMWDAGGCSPILLVCFCCLAIGGLITLLIFGIVCLAQGNGGHPPGGAERKIRSTPPVHRKSAILYTGVPGGENDGRRALVQAKTSAARQSGRSAAGGNRTDTKMLSTHLTDTKGGSAQGFT